MKLLTKSTLYFLTTSLIVFLIGGISVYFLLQAIIKEEVDESLEDRQSALLWELDKPGGFANIVLPSDSSIKIHSSNSALSEPVFKDTTLYDDIENENLPYRYVKFSAVINEQQKVVTIFQPLIDEDDLVEAIIYSLSVVFAIVLIAITAMNFFGMQHLWGPFKEILEQIKFFDFREKNTIKRISTDITEFIELNNELSKMSEKLTKDYMSLKEFSENASHEMQTPLAIIQSKLELLFQKTDISDENVKALNSAYQAVNRLSRLHHDLNLLTRIENQEYKNFEIIKLEDFLQNQVNNFTEIAELKNLQIESNIKSQIEIETNRYLLETLFSNLLSNAINHNSKNGAIRIELQEKILTISNDGDEPDIAPESFFERFKKAKPSKGSGLGLAIVKNICDFLKFDISYTYTKMHIVTIDFNN